MDQQRIIDHFKDSDVDIIHILQAQKIAVQCLRHMEDFLRPGLTRDQIHQECASYMTGLGSLGWWIHNDPALILFGDLSNYSAHEPPNYEGLTISENDLITIDVAPMIQSGWGDMARSFVMEEGKIIPWRQSQNKEIIEGMELELKLHRLFMDSVNEKTTFEDLHHLIDEEVKKAGYCNCDYHGNYGHTIE
ncbi:MAG: aminopeptidase P family protein, partial [Erysipelotrichaceae bacterium]|nr:aminopeptidase P family protein [Erysipelotrichaceae bacterium]